MAREVLPHVPDAWVDQSKTKIGYEIPLNRHFYVYEPPRPLDDNRRRPTRTRTRHHRAASRCDLMRRPYPSYRNSGVEWLGEVPEHWEVRRVRHTCQFAYGDSLPAEDRQPGEIPVFGSNGPVDYHDDSQHTRSHHCDRSQAGLMVR